MAHFAKGSHVLLFLSCFVSWNKTTALLIFCRVRGKKEGLAEEWGGKLEKRRAKSVRLWGRGPEGGP